MFKSYEQLVDAIGEAPAGQTLDRIDPNGNYEPGNVRWATAKEQAENRRNTLKVEFRGEMMSVAEFCRRMTFPRYHIDKWRRKGCTLEEAFENVKTEFGLHTVQENTEEVELVEP